MQTAYYSHVTPYGFCDGPDSWYQYRGTVEITLAESKSITKCGIDYANQVRTSPSIRYNDAQGYLISVNIRGDPRLFIQKIEDVIHFLDTYLPKGIKPFLGRHIDLSRFLPISQCFPADFSESIIKKLSTGIHYPSSSESQENVDKEISENIQKMFGILETDLTPCQKDTYARSLQIALSKLIVTTASSSSSSVVSNVNTNLVDDYKTYMDIISKDIKSPRFETAPRLCKLAQEHYFCRLAMVRVIMEKYEHSYDMRISTVVHKTQLRILGEMKCKCSECIDEPISSWPNTDGFSDEANIYFNFLRFYGLPFPYLLLAK